jgi:hypothetical protein
MVSGLMSLSGTASPGRPHREVELSAYMVSITPYLNSARDLAAVLNDAGPRVLPIVGTGSARHIGDVLSLSDMDAESAASHVLRNFAGSQKGNRSMHHRLRVADRLDRTEQRKLCASATHVVRQERPNTHPGETARDSATIKPTIADRSEPTASIAAPQPIALRPIGSSNQPLRLEIQKPARLPLQIEPEEAARESFILVLSGAPTGTTLSGAARIGSDTWFLAPGSSNQLEITLPEWSTSVFEINIVLRRTTGLLAA